MNENELEQALRSALRPVDPGRGFTERVLERLDRSTAAPPRRRFIRWAPVALAACTIAAVGLVHLRQEALERQRGRDAGAQLLQALSIASANVNVVRAAVISLEEPRR